MGPSPLRRGARTGWCAMTTFLTTPRPWDDGIRWHLEQSAAEGPDFALDPLELTFVRDQHLRSANGEVENPYVEWLIRASYRQAEKFTNRSLITQTRRMVLSGFPWGDIYLPLGPVLSVESIDYFDSSSSSAVLGGSPAEFDLVSPSGYQNRPARLMPLPGASWPSAYAQSDAVTVTYEAGYPVNSDTGFAAIPEDINDARLQWIGERYKQRSLTDHAFNQNKAAIQARSIWMQYRIY